MHNPVTGAGRSKHQLKAAFSETGSGPAAMTAGEMRESVARARSYAFLWLLMRDEMSRRVDALENDRVASPERPSGP